MSELAMKLGAIVLLVASIAGAGCRTNRPEPMSFFVTSVGKGDGGNLGGLDGADAHCRRLASAAGADRLEWRAHLSAPARDRHPPPNARDRLRSRPRVHPEGARIASNLRD